MPRTKIIRVVDKPCVASNEPILCRECKNDSFNLGESETGSLNIVCSRCGAFSTFGSGLDVKGLLGILKDPRLKL